MVQCPLCRTRYADGTSACPLDGAAPTAVPGAGAYGPSWSRLDRSGEVVAARGHTGGDETAARDPLRDSLIGQTLEGRLRVLRRIGQGGMGTVYVAEHVSLGKQVAIKVLNAQYASQPDVVPRLHIEARHAAAIQNEHIVDIFDIGTIHAGHAGHGGHDPDGAAGPGGDDGAAVAAGRPYMVMELLQGESLAQRLARCSALSEADTLSIGRQLAAALDAAHRQGIVHRDIKPENIFLCPAREPGPAGDPAPGSGSPRPTGSSGPTGAHISAERPGGDFVKLLDFGISKVLRPLGYTSSAAGDAPGGEALTEPRLTRTGAILGTPLYMSPEQVRGEPLDHRVDVYALGVVLYECLTGSVPYSAPSYLAVVAKILTEPPEPPSSRTPERPISPQLERIVLRAMAPARDERYPTMGALLEDLERYDAGEALGTQMWTGPLDKTRASRGAAERLLLGGVQTELWRPLLIGMALVLGSGLLMAVALRRTAPPAPRPLLAAPGQPVRAVSAGIGSTVSAGRLGAVAPGEATPPLVPAAQPAADLPAPAPEPPAGAAALPAEPPAEPEARAAEAAATPPASDPERPRSRRVRTRTDTPRHEPTPAPQIDPLLEEQAPNPFETRGRP